MAGEEELQQTIQQKKGPQRPLKPCSFTTRFLAGVRDQGLLLDDILCGRVAPAPQAVAAEPLEVLLEARRSVGNAIVKLVFLSIILFPLIVLLPLTIPLTAIAVRRWRYRIEATRIVLGSEGLLMTWELDSRDTEVPALAVERGVVDAESCRSRMERWFPADDFHQVRLFDFLETVVTAYLWQSGVGGGFLI